MKESGKTSGDTDGLQKSESRDGDSQTVRPKGIYKPGTKITKTAPGNVLVQIGRSLDAMLADICTPTGTRNDEVAIRIIDQVGRSLVLPRPEGVDATLIQAISTIAEMAPQNITEALLATQMIATHEAALKFVAYATRDNQTFEGCDANVLRATRLMRVFNEQLEAMQRLKGKAGQQKVTVEHVHVHEGGQAIVGAVTTNRPAPGEGDGTENL